MKILVVGNSVSTPPFAGAAAYPELLAQRLGSSATIETVIGSGETIAQLESRIVDAIARRPDWLILQVGINECAPRPLSVAERARLGRLRPKWLQWRIIRAIHHLRPWIIKARPLHQFMPLAEFVDTVRRVVALAQSNAIGVLVLPITGVAAAAERRTPFTNREVARYNDALQQLSTTRVRVMTQREIFGTDDATSLVAAPDTVHLAPSAHERIADFLTGLFMAGSPSAVSR